MKRSKFVKIPLPFLLLWAFPFVLAQEKDETPKKEEKSAVAVGYSFQTSTQTGSDPDAKVETKVFFTSGGEVKKFPSNAHVLVKRDDDDGDNKAKTITVFTAEGQDHDGNPFVLEFNPKHGVLGVETVELTEELRLHFGAPKDAGIMIGKVIEDGPAQLAQIQVGDILTHLNGEPVASSGELLKVLTRHKPGDALEAELWRDGITLNAMVTLGESEMEFGLFPEDRAKFKVLLEPSEDFVFNYKTEAGSKELPLIEWVSTSQTDLKQQLEDLKKKIDALEQKIRKEAEEK